MGEVLTYLPVGAAFLLIGAALAYGKTVSNHETRIGELEKFEKVLEKIADRVKDLEQMDAYERGRRDGSQSTATGPRPSVDGR